VNEAPFVSIVVPTLNRCQLLDECLRSLMAQTYPSDRFEILVVDDGSVDATADVVRARAGQGAPRVRYLAMSHGGPNAARNAGIAAAAGDPICLVDDDVSVPDAWLEAMVDGCLRHTEAGCLGGPVRMRFEVPPPRICEMESWIWEAELDYGPAERLVEQVNSTNMAVRRRALEAIGPFDASLPIYGDETEWEVRLRRAGIPIAYLPAAWLWHRRTAADLRHATMFRRRFRQGVAYAGYATRMGERISLTRTAWPIPFYLAHAARRRCFGAVLEVSRKLGLVWGELRRRARGSRRP
jgi:GT2 family glycosyltransferase